MPTSDTWPGGTGLETMISMDSAGSCDSVVSANSGFSDDSLEHLSAEEKACLMFLEETIDSLDTEEDSGLSNDEPEQLPVPGSLNTKLADLSASISKSKLNSSQKPASKETIKKSDDTKPIQSYLVNTPLVVARISPSSVPTAKPGVLPDKNLSSQPHFQPPTNKEPGWKHNLKPAVPQVPLEVNVLIPPPTKPRDQSVRIVEGPLPRGPLSYDALVHLQRSASAKKTPLCPKIDHTIDLDTHLPIIEEGQNLGNLPRSDRFLSEASMSKTGPPVVAPKPKKIPANISVKIQNQASITSDSSYNVKNATDPQVVRLEALQKLGLMKDQEPENETVAPLPPPKSRSSLDSTPNKLTSGPSHVNAPRSPSFCHSQVSAEPENKLQNRSDQQPVPHPAQANGLKPAGLEHFATLDDHRNGGHCPEPQHNKATKPVKATAAAQPVPQKPSNSVAYTVMVVPGMGADRKEALRKLGLLKI